MLAFGLVLLFPVVFSQTTSQGILSGGISDLGFEISDVSSDSYSSLSSLNTKFESEQDFASDTSESLILSRISELNSELLNIESSISTLTAALSLANANCKENTDCNSCTSSEACVWCTIESLCVNGDEYGPLYGECIDYLYDKCSYAGCNEYLECELCISDNACGWCSIGHSCYEATSVLKGDCKFEYFYHAAGNTDCPVYTSPTETLSINSEIILQMEIDQLESIQLALLSEIFDLEETREKIVKEANKEIELPLPNTGKDYSGIGETVDSQANQEKDEELAFQEDLWADWAFEISEDIDDVVTIEYDDVIDALEVYQDNDDILL